MKKNRTLKRILSLVIIAAVMLSVMSMTVFAGSATQAKDSVVAIQGINGSGSGFAIGEVGKDIEYIVTNAHVVEGSNEAYVIFDGASNDFVSALVYEYDEERDLAILKLPHPTDKREAMTICPIKDVDLDDDFVALGFPAGQVQDWETYNIDDITVTRGGIKKQTRDGGREVYILDLEITHGNSGGPLVNSAGEVIGINTYGWRISDGTTVYENNYAIAIDELLDLTEANKIPVTLHGAINLTLIIIIAAVAVLLGIGVLVLILVLRKKKPAASVSSNDYVPQPAPAAPVAPITPAAAPVAAPVAPAAAPAVRVIAIGGAINGRKYSITGSAKIGRDPSRCGINFPVNTQGVSAVHCEVGFDGSVCYVNDLGSSYGTFTIDGTKLAPNTPHVLKSGEKFYLASPENTFEVRF